MIIFRVAGTYKGNRKSTSLRDATIETRHTLRQVDGVHSIPYGAHHVRMRRRNGGGWARNWFIFAANERSQRVSSQPVFFCSFAHHSGPVSVCVYMCVCGRTTRHLSLSRTRHWLPRKKRKERFFKGASLSFIIWWFPPLSPHKFEDLSADLSSTLRFARVCDFLVVLPYWSLNRRVNFH